MQGSMENDRSGRDLLVRRADLERARLDMPAYRDFLLIDDDAFDGKVLSAVLHVWYGYDIEVRMAASMGAAMDELQIRTPDIIFLDDLLPPVGNALENIPHLRKWGYNGPVVIISGMVDRLRRLKLIEVGAADVLHKDDLSSLHLAEILIQIGENDPSHGGAGG